MRIDLLNPNKFIKDNDCKEITNAIYFSFGNIPTSDGLFSTEIFGAVGSDKRKETFAYIDLGRRFLHPVIYRIITTLNKKLIGLISGTTFFTLNSKGELVEDSKNGQTGLDYLYEIYDKIKWRTTTSFKRDDKIAVLEKTPKDEAFLDKWLVIPPFIRDFQIDEKGEMASVDKINMYYVKLIRLCQTYKSSSDFSLNFLTNTNNFNVQLLLYDIYDFCTKQLAKKTGLIHKSLIGKTVDYATRSVISAPMINSTRYNNLQVPFTYTGIPLSQVITLFKPFFVYEIQTWIEENLTSITESAKKKGVTLKNIMEQFDETHITKMMDNYIKNIAGRFDPILLEDINGNKCSLDIYSNELKRKFAPIDLFFITGKQIIKNKHVYVTRYPITSFQSIYPSRIKILTTIKTQNMTLGSLYFDDYPLSFEDYPQFRENDDKFFIDSTRIHNSYCAALNADFDGDTISIRGVYSQEANDEAEKIINGKTFLLQSNGDAIRLVSNECIQSLYGLTF